MDSTDKVANMKAFVSYKSDDKKFATQLADGLRTRGIDAWLDDWNMPPGKPISDAMQDGINESDVMLLVLTPASAAAIHDGKGGIAFEVHLGEGRRFQDTNFRIIGIRRQDCSPPEKLRNRLGRWLDFRADQDFDMACDDLAKWITNPKADTGPPVRWPVSWKGRIQTSMSQIRIEKIVGMRADFAILLGYLVFFVLMWRTSDIAKQYPNYGMEVRLGDQVSWGVATVFMLAVGTLGIFFGTKPRFGVLRHVMLWPGAVVWLLFALDGYEEARRLGILP